MLWVAMAGAGAIVGGAVEVYGVERWFILVAGLTALGIVQ